MKPALLVGVTVCLVMGQMIGISPTWAEEGKQEFTHQLWQPSLFYLSGPQQGRPPDGEFRAGTLVRIVEEAGSYILVQSEENITAFVDASALAPINDQSTSVAQLLQDLDSSHYGTRIKAAEALGQLGAEGQEALSRLRELSKHDPDEYVRVYARRAYTTIKKAFEPADAEGEESSPSIAELIQDLESPETVRRVQAVKALAALGQKSQEAVPRLEELAAHDPIAKVQKYANLALKKIRGKRLPAPGPVNAGIGQQSSHHTLLVVGTQPIYLYHLPMFNDEHGMQVILQVEFDDRTQRLYRQQSEQETASGFTTFWVGEQIPLGSLGEDPAVLRGHLFSGDMMRGGTTLKKSVQATVVKVIYREELDPQATTPEFPEYIVFGSASQTFLAHKIAGVPNYDQILEVSRERDVDSTITDGTIVTALGLSGGPATRIQEGQYVSHGVLGAYTEEDVQQPFPFRVRQELYHDTADLVLDEMTQ